jgi:hypothetical protein
METAIPGMIRLYGSCKAEAIPRQWRPSKGMCLKRCGIKDKEKH